MDNKGTWDCFIVASKFALRTGVGIAISAKVCPPHIASRTGCVDNNIDSHIITSPAAGSLKIAAAGGFVFRRMEILFSKVLVVATRTKYTSRGFKVLPSEILFCHCRSIRERPSVSRQLQICPTQEESVPRPYLLLLLQVSEGSDVFLLTL